MNDYEKAVRRELLIERGKTMKWLAEEVNRLSGLRIDNSYLAKVLSGKVGSVAVVTAIEAILGVAVPDGYGRGGFKG